MASRQNVSRGYKLGCETAMKVRGNGYWILDIGYWILDIGYWILDIGYWILDIGYWILDIL